MTYVASLEEYDLVGNETPAYNFSVFGGNWEDSMWQHVIEDFKQDQLTLNEPTTIVLLVLYVPIFLTSLAGNVLVLLVIVPNQRMWTVTNNFLVNLAVADLLVTLLCMPMTLAGKIYRLWIYGNVMCKMTPYLQGVSVASSTFTITVMSLDRCLAILHPVTFRNMRTKRNVRTLIAIIWFISMMMMIPLLFVNKTKSQEIFVNFKVTTCVEAWESVIQRRAYDFSLLFIVCLVPAQIVFISYLLMGKRLWVTDHRLDVDSDGKQKTSGVGTNKGSFNQIRASRRRTAKMCIVVSVVFVVCWLPYYAVNIYLDFKRDQDAVDIVYWGLLIGHLHCLTNPILYCFMHKAFRYCVKRMFPCWRNSLVRLPSAYGTNGGCGNRASSVVASIRSKRPPGDRSPSKKHVKLAFSPSNTSSNVSARSACPMEHQENDKLVVDYHKHDDTNKQKVKLIFKRLQDKHLCNNNSDSSLNGNEGLEVTDKDQCSNNVSICDK